MGKRNPIAEPDPNSDLPVTQAELAALTAAFVGLRRGVNSSMVETAARLGLIVRRGRKGLGWTAFKRWVEDDLGMAVRSALRLAAIFEFSRRHPRRFDDLKHRGVAILGDIASLPAGSISRVLRARTIAAAGGERVTLEEASPLQVREAIQPLRRQPQHFNARARATAVRSAADQARKRLISLRGRWGRVPPDILRSMAASLEALCRVVRAAPWEA